ncbi:MAG: hypothetical protein N4A48_03760 [Tepidibacter sp.]|jgi:alpha-tubulin suppressor-like RCC1 family protein|uniref:RCC1 domain-containing protein n=1 Tax=Tepidibacter sp. TaxID=2529387 RepID=UPI0025ED1E12|nr:hypothetical protein [Tepidibacter sp.]MCT4507865.1 hypothetical protein [Tepidibacter sp.]
MYGLKKDGTIWTWGEDLLNIREESKKCTYEPIQISITNKWKDMYAGQCHLIMLDKDGYIWFIGDQSNLKLFEGSDNIISAKRINNSEWSNISAYDNGLLGIKKDGTLWAAGQYAISDYTNIEYNDIKRKFYQVGNDSDWKKVGLGGWSNAIAMKKDGSLYWLGKPYESNNRFSYKLEKIRKIAGGNDWLDFSISGSHVLAIKKDGTLWAWGRNDNGELGDGTTEYRETPIKISDEKYKDILASDDSSFAIKEDGTLWGWGKNDNNQLGVEVIRGVYTPTRVNF